MSNGLQLEIIIPIITNVSGLVIYEIYKSRDVIHPLETNTGDYRLVFQLPFCPVCVLHTELYNSRMLREKKNIMEQFLASK